MADVKWIKVATRIYDSKKIKQIRKLPNGDNIVLLWIFMLCLAGDINECGILQLTEDIPYTEEMLAEEFRMDVNTVRLGIDTFERYKMIHCSASGALCISNWEEYQNIDGMEKIKEQNRIRKQNQRDRERKALNTSRDCHADVT